MNIQPIPMEQVESSQIAEIGHDATTNTLAIRFTAKPGHRGSLYHYDNFTTETFQAFRSADSIGSFFHKNIKHRDDLYPFKKIDEQPEPAAA